MTMRRALRSPVSWATTALVVAVLTGCGAAADGSGGPDGGQPSGITQEGNQASTSTSTTAPAPSTPAPSSATQEADMQIEIQVGHERLTATVDDTPAGRDLLDQLPQTIEMSDHGGVEKTGTLRAPLSLDGQPDGADPDVGDLGYYAPGNDLVLYYGDQSAYPGIVVIGRLDDSAVSRLAASTGDITATVTTAHGS